ncbi:hypothetical protein [Salinispora sp. H7-4]|uniref:hypothetical protein n=1 Tax=Salinispora sp. H7-4 TaxID=2748321 RepID=UPI0015D29F44|nr:hypothetical protein [Salinispora sp. H7-4]NYT95325.1 hypothetical protein [Salinispora sp. H7-4]
MHISMWVPYDEQRMRRFYRHTARRQLRTFRILGGVLITLGVALTAMDLPTDLDSINLGVGLLFVFGLGPMLGKSQTAVIVPKNAMAQEQRAEFATFVNTLQPAAS